MALETTATFIGHNECFGLSAEKLKNTIRELIKKGVTDFLSGGQGGFDRLCGRCVYELKKEFPHINNYLVIPYLSFNVYTANGASEMIKEIVANIKTDDLEILFRMDSGYFDEKIIETIESLGCKYLIKAKSYSTLASQATNSSVVFVKGEEGRETTELFTKLDNWEKDRRFVVSRVLKPEKERAQISLLEGSEYEYFFFVTNTTLLSEKVVISYEKRGNAENYIKEAKYDMAVGHLLLKSFWANEAVFQMMMLSYNLFLLFKIDSLEPSEYRQQIKTFRLKYVFLAAKIIKTARTVIMNLSENYPYKEVYEKCLV